MFFFFIVVLLNNDVVVDDDNFVSDYIVFVIDDVDDVVFVIKMHMVLITLVNYLFVYYLAL